VRSGYGHIKYRCQFLGGLLKQFPQSLNLFVLLGQFIKLVYAAAFSAYSFSRRYKKAQF
jgi:hypothetical protein